MKVCVLGGGGREHALVWRLRKDGHEVVALPGSDAIPGSLGGALDGALDVLAIVRAHHVELVVVGPEAPLSKGVADVLRDSGIPVVGPSKKAAQLETSKAFAKAFMTRNGVATSLYQDAASAGDAISLLADGPVVVKFDGLAAGKGVVVCDDRPAAEHAIRELAAVHGDKAHFVMEERLHGPEVSLIVLTDGRYVVRFPLARDHKRLGDGDQGPNTGGMGVIAPVPGVSPEALQAIDDRIVKPTLEGLEREGLDYRGILYFGIMLTELGPKLLEYNVRFGDPEAEALLPLVGGDFGAALLACARGSLGGASLVATGASSVCVVAASPGYPGASTAGLEIHGLDEEDASDVVVFHAGTKREGDKWLTAGGRVLNVVGIGNSLTEARAKAYSRLARIRFAEMQFRKDIGAREERA
ncbi:MAG: phosphoribosylamine--glycine ligase [Polyangiaceae bacterium]